MGSSERRALISALVLRQLARASSACVGRRAFVSEARWGSTSDPVLFDNANAPLSKAAPPKRQRLSTGTF